jgi:hypothetical protein
MAQKKSRSTFEKLKREQAVKERRVRKQERKAAAKLAKELGLSPDGSDMNGEPGMTGEPGMNGEPGTTDEADTTDEPDTTAEAEPGQAL